MQPEDSRPAIGDSPLLNTGAVAPSENTVHPDRLDMSRFSDMSEDSEGRSPVRIIMYVLIVIAIGVAAALAVRYFLLDDSNSDADTAEEAPVETESALVINEAILDDLDATNRTLKASYKTSEQISFGDASLDSETVEELGSIIYQPYTSFVRVTMNFEGAGVPASTINYDDSENTLTIDLIKDLPVADGLDEIAAIGSLVNSITPDLIENSFTLDLEESFLYNVQVVNGSVIIDIISEEAFANYVDPTEETEEPAVIPDTPTEETEEDNTPVTNDPNKPEGTNFDNNFSQNKQFVTNVTTGNTISYNETFYGDLGNAFELAWGSRNNVGVDYIPNATAELKSDSQGDYIEVVIENLATVSPQDRLDESNMSIPLGGANFTSMTLESFESGVATYRINLRNKADFKLYTDTTVSGATQVIALQIQD